MEDSTALNFFKPLNKALNNAQSWNETFDIDGQGPCGQDFHIFIHTLNVVHIHTAQIQLIQNLLNSFVWKGHAKVHQMVACALVSDGGFNMLHVKNVVHGLRVKWYLGLCTDIGFSWSQFIWPDLTALIPYQLLQGLWSVSKQILSQLPPFYAGVICSYAYVNDLYYKNYDTSELLHNLWCGVLFLYIDPDWVKADLFTVANLPLANGKIDVMAIKQSLLLVGCSCSLYLKCCAFQKGFGSLLGLEVNGTFLPNQHLPLMMKQLLRDNSTCILLMTNWCTYFHLVPLEVPELERIFHRMLVVCKILKFREINFKILSHILANPKIIT